MSIPSKLRGAPVCFFVLLLLLLTVILCLARVSQGELSRKVKKKKKKKKEKEKKEKEKKNCRISNCWLKRYTTRVINDSVREGGRERERER